MISITLISLSFSGVFAADEADQIAESTDTSDSYVLEDTSNTFEITQDNYDNYFNMYTGEIKADSNINSGDTLKIGNITNRAFVIDRQLTLMPLSANDKIVNGFVHLTKGSDGSSVLNLTINNTKSVLSINTQDVGMLHGIWLSDTDNITLSHNTIRIANSGGVYAMPIQNSNGNTIIYNDMITWITCNIIMADSSYNLISNNRLEVLNYSEFSVTNLIYYCPFSFAGRLISSLCVANTITYNDFIGYSTGAMSIIIQAIYDNNVNTTVAHNRILKGSYGINLYGDNSLIYNNTVYNSAVGISAIGGNVSVIENTVSGDSQASGIHISGSENATSVARGNNISFVDVVEGLSIGDNVNAYNNTIYIADYGVGIRLNSNNSKVYANRVRSSYDDAVVFLSNNSRITDNILISNARGVSITTEGSNRYYNNTISGNKISSGSYGIFLKGLVYNTTISSNVIETNASSGIYREITDEASNDNHDNMINGIIYDSTSLVINDTNYHNYFDENGYFNYTFGEDEISTVFLTFLSDKNLIFTDMINIISNKMSNLLYNVTITLKGDASGSLIRDFNFMNFNRNAVVLEGVGNVNVESNNITVICSDEIATVCGILVLKSDNSNIISNNNIYINSRANYTYGISVSAYNPYTREYNRNLAKGFVISDNNIIIIANGVAEAVFSDCICESEVSHNTINIISSGDAYGIAAVNVIGRLHDWNISDNEIVIHSNQMTYLIENHMTDNMSVSNNYLYSQSSGAYGVACYETSFISIYNNVFNIPAGDLSNTKKDSDIIPPGNAAVFLCANNTFVNISDNVIYTNSTPIVFDDGSDVNLSNNSFIIDDDNYLTYFISNKINSSIIKSGDNILLSNITVNPTFIVDVCANIYSYNNHCITLNLTVLASNLNITGLNFVNSTVTLYDSSDIAVFNNTFTDSDLFIIASSANNISSNQFNASVVLTGSDLNTIDSNTFNSNNSVLIDASNSNKITGNTFNAASDVIITLIGSGNNLVENNNLTGSGDNISAIYLSGSSDNTVKSNYIYLESMTARSAVTLADQSKSNLITDNYIVFNGCDDNYAVSVVSDKNLLNNITFNYLVSGLRRANSAVSADYDFVSGNSPYDIYVSSDGDDDTGDGSELKPFKTLSYALRNSLNHVVIKIIKGNFTESNLLIDKNITIIGLNHDISIDADNKQLFTILNNATLTVESLTLMNAFDVKGGALFKNSGNLYIFNSQICNSSSYYDNSNPVFDDMIDDTHWQSHDCRNEGLGGAILNYGNLVINNSKLYNNFAHTGGVLADFGNTEISSSVFYSNRAVHGGVIYSKSKNTLYVTDSMFLDNTAVITLNYCMVKKSVSGWSIDTGNTYSYSSMCNLLTGAGGAIYTLNDLVVSNSVFNHNTAWKGGAIASDFTSSHSNVNLTLNNSSFINNRATNESKILDSPLVYMFPFNSEYRGGAVYGEFNALDATNCEFMGNHAQNDGGAFYVRAGEGIIDLCNFTENRAGSSGGALDISSNFLITRTVISNNSASYGGAINYQSYSYYGHIQNHLNIYNSTICDNMALDAGGALRVGQSNVTIHDCNIYGNFAPEGSTMSSSYYTSNPSVVSADVRYNWWGIDANGKVLSADDSVYNFPNVQTGRKSNTRFEWITEDSTDDDVNPPAPVNPGSSDDNGNNPIVVVNPSGTSSSQSTNSHIGVPDMSSGGNVIDPYAVPGDGSNSGGGGFSPFNGNSESGNSSNTISNVPANGNQPKSNGNTDSNDLSQLFDDLMNYINSNTASKENAHVKNTTDNQNSLSRSESVSYDDSLNTVGTISNAIAAAPEVSSGQSAALGSSSASESSSSKSYELDDEHSVKKQADNMVAFIAFAALILLFLIFGYKRGKNDDL